MKKGKLKRVSITEFVVAMGLVVGLLVIPQGVRAADGGGWVGDRFVVRDEVEREVHPSVAYNSKWNEYLVVLFNDRPGNDDIRAERFDSNGRSLGGKWVAAGPGAERRYPDVTYNRDRNEYLVVWEEEIPATSQSLIKARRLAADATPIGTEVPVFTGITGVLMPRNPAVAYAHTSQTFLVVWEYEVNVGPPPSVTHIESEVLDALGAPFHTIDISLDPGGAPRQSPDVAYNRHANRFLVVWQQWDPGASLWDVWSRLVDGDGPPPDWSPVRLAYYSVHSTAPAVAAIPTSPTAEKYLVVWEHHHPTTGRDIYGIMVDEGGMPHAGDIKITMSSADETSPAVAGSESGQRYLVVWRKQQGVIDVPIAGQALASTGYEVGLEDTIGAPAANYPAVASGPVGGFLATYQDQAPWATHSGVWGHKWGNQAYLPLVVRNR
ncbi:MAG: hypothetical protein PVI09_12120 [Anaerolineae bacterium]|jgi:hypothetical protein